MRLGWWLFAIVICFTHAQLTRPNTIWAPTRIKFNPLKFGHRITLTFGRNLPRDVNYTYSLRYTEGETRHCSGGRIPRFTKGGTAANRLVILQSQDCVLEMKPGTWDTDERCDCHIPGEEILGITLRTSQRIPLQVRIGGRVYKQEDNGIRKLTGGGLTLGNLPREMPNVFVADIYGIERHSTSLALQFHTDRESGWLFEIRFHQRAISATLRLPPDHRLNRQRAAKSWTVPWQASIDGPYVQLMLAVVEGRILVTLNNRCFAQFPFNTRAYHLEDTSLKYVTVDDRSELLQRPWHSHLLGMQLERWRDTELPPRDHCWDGSENYLQH
ncbi:unnamed protein product, partial [Mesorhabditis spiculigera]